MVRVQPDLLAKLDDWATAKEDRPSRPEAIRRLVELGLAKEPSEKPARKPGARAFRSGAIVAGKMIAASGLVKPSKKSSEMAGEVIDRLGDEAATDDERARRKRRLIKGPLEFREMRGRKPKA